MEDKKSTRDQLWQPQQTSTPAIGPASPQRGAAASRAASAVGAEHFPPNKRPAMQLFRVLVAKQKLLRVVRPHRDSTVEVLDDLLFHLQRGNLYICTWSGIDFDML